MFGSLDTFDSSGLDAKVFAFEGAKNFSYECEFGGMDCQRSKLENVELRVGEYYFYLVMFRIGTLCSRA